MGLALTVAGLIMAPLVSAAFWALVAIGVVVAGGAIGVALTRAMRPALRAQTVKYDHSWVTNALGETYDHRRHPRRLGRRAYAGRGLRIVGARHAIASKSLKLCSERVAPVFAVRLA
jgi:hypothetical protein